MQGGVRVSPRDWIESGKLVRVGCSRIYDEGVGHHLRAKFPGLEAGPLFADGEYDHHRDSRHALVV